MPMSSENAAVQQDQPANESRSIAQRIWRILRGARLVVPLVIPGVILGISILVLASSIANGFEDNLDLELDFLRPP